MYQAPKWYFPPMPKLTGDGTGTGNCEMSAHCRVRSNINLHIFTKKCALGTKPKLCDPECSRPWSKPTKDPLEPLERREAWRDPLHEAV